MRLVLATNNQDKVREIRDLLDGMGIEILTSNDFDNLPEIEETGMTMEENAILKAQGINKATGIPALADDSGIEIDFLNGAPGVFSSRYAGPGCTYDDNNRKVLKELQGVPRDKRTARFRCIIAICFGESDTRTVEGIADGFITENKVKASGGFGYDPVFYYPPAGKTFAEMSLAEKNKVSHRGLALAKARQLLFEELQRA